MFKFIAVVFALVVVAAPAHSRSRATYPSDGGLEGAVLDEINFARTRPLDYAQSLRRGPRSEAVDEAVDFLERQTPLAPLTWEPRLAASAAWLAADQGPSGGVSHTGSDGTRPMQRAQRQGLWSGIVAEEISLGEQGDRDVVRQLIVDLGVAGRPHRRDLFSPVLKLAGVGCAPHRSYGTICVVDLSGTPMVR
jgi:uncharacterized protein YkwD